MNPRWIGRAGIAALVVAAAVAGLPGGAGAPSPERPDGAPAPSLVERLFDRKDKPAEAPRPPAAPAVAVVPAASAELVDAVVVTGTLVARDEVLVGPEIEGLRLVELLAEEGDRVTRGQVLARLSRETLDAQLAQSDAALARGAAAIAQARSQIAQAEAGLVEANAALGRARALQGSGALTEATLDQRVAAARTTEARLAAARDGLALAQAELKQFEAQRKELLVRIARTEVRAPEAGLVSRRGARLGAIASGVGEPLFRLIARGEVELDAEIPESRLVKLAPGQPVAVTLADGRAIRGRVRLVGPEVERATRLGRVRVALDPDPALRVGSFARGVVEAARTRAVAVPASAVLHGEASARLLVVAGERVEVRRVRLGLAVDGLAQVVEGVAEGELVVARAAGFLHDGDLVRPILPEPVATGAIAGAR